ncbi:hypothetical protein ACP70R_041018 [Stipagrostis hirtigluma subsp. patula]
MGVGRFAPMDQRSAPSKQAQWVTGSTQETEKGRWIDPWSTVGSIHSPDASARVEDGGRRPPGTQSRGSGSPPPPLLLPARHFLRPRLAVLDGGHPERGAGLSSAAISFISWVAADDASLLVASSRPRLDDLVIPAAPRQVEAV